MNKIEKVELIRACPSCRVPLKKAQDGLKCEQCETSFTVVSETSVMLNKSHSLLSYYESGEYQPQQFNKRKLPTPEERLWSNSSKRCIRKLLQDINPDDPNKVVLNLGAGIEKIFISAFSKYKTVIRLGLPTRGKVEIIGDAEELPVTSDSVDAYLSSSVLEHVKNPDKAVAEMFRVVKKGGVVYAEIPFMRAYHMAPWDYQRYTYSGIEALFERHGFQLIEKGICSGPFTSWALFTRDFFVVIMPAGILKKLTRIFFSWTLHPVKYLDLLVEKKKWSRFLACNFYYYGFKP
jgi:SAM-dependent methyltransferase